MRNAAEVVHRDLEYIVSSLQDELSHLAGKNALITGGAGFLGYYFVQALMRWNTHADQTNRVHVTVYDNYARGIPKWLTQLESEECLSIVKHDITQPLPQEMPDFQYIIHAASIASPTYYRQHPIETMDANVGGLRLLLDYCRSQSERNSPVEGFLFLSSSEIYGDPSPENIPTAETYRGIVSCTGPRACYDESKRYGETLCVNFGQQYGLPVKIARPFNNYGPGLKVTDKRALPDFARDVLSGRDIVLFSDGSPTRTFCYTADAIVGYYKVLFKGRNAEAYNIGVEDGEISIGDLAERVVDLSTRLFGYKGRVIRRVSPDPEYLTDNPNRRCPNIAKARQELNYNPTISVDEGLTRSLIWYTDNREGEEG